MFETYRFELGEVMLLVGGNGGKNPAARPAANVRRRAREQRGQHIWTLRRNDYVDDMPFPPGGYSEVPRQLMAILHHPASGASG
jgi:hypothetical protein